MGAGPVLLVLDNLHELRSAAVHEGLLGLIERPPKGLRIVATSREDPPWPLDALRLTGALCEVRSEELAFRAHEAGAMLSTAGIELEPDVLAQLVGRTEGWAAALRLAALELAENRDPAGRVATFSGDDHSVAGYLLTEVLGRAAPPARDLLGKICVLDFVCADLADAVTGRNDGAARLAELQASNLFVHSMGRPGRWYQLHRLVADLLRAQLTDPRQRRDLHRRAAEWHREHGMPLEAVRYALRGGLWRLAADIVGVHLVPLVIGGRPRDLHVELGSAPQEVIWAHPELASALAGARVMEGRPEEVAQLIAVARAGLADLPPPRARRTEVVLNLIEAGYARLVGDLPRVIAACRRVPEDVPALSRLGFVDWHTLRIVTLGNLGTAEAWIGEHVDAEKHLRVAIDTERWGRTLLPHLNARRTWRCCTTSVATWSPQRPTRWPQSTRQGPWAGPARRRLRRSTSPWPASTWTATISTRPTYGWGGWRTSATVQNHTCGWPPRVFGQRDVQQWAISSRPWSACAPPSIWPSAIRSRRR